MKKAQAENRKSERRMYVFWNDEKERIQERLRERYESDNDYNFTDADGADGSASSDPDESDGATATFIIRLPRDMSNVRRWSVHEGHDEDYLHRRKTTRASINCEGRQDNDVVVDLDEDTAEVVQRKMHIIETKAGEFCQAGHGVDRGRYEVGAIGEEEDKEEVQVKDH